MAKALEAVPGSQQLIRLDSRSSIPELPGNRSNRSDGKPLIDPDHGDPGCWVGHWKQRIFKRACRKKLITIFISRFLFKNSVPGERRAHCFCRDAEPTSLRITNRLLSRNLLNPFCLSCGNKKTQKNSVFFLAQTEVFPADFQHRFKDPKSTKKTANSNSFASELL